MIDSYVREWKDAVGTLRDGAIEALTVGLGRYERDAFFDQYYRLLGPLEHFTGADPATVGRRVS